MRKAVTFIFIFFTAGRALAFDWEVKRFDGRDYAPLVKVAEFYSLPQQFSVENNHISLYRGSRSLVVTRDLRDVEINGVKYILSFPVIDREGTYWISRMDIGKTIEPAFRPELVADIKPFTTVVLDPGHGGHDNGASSPYEYEKNFSLDVARRVRNELQKAGVNVFMTRNRDAFVELQDRAALANGKQNSIFVSIHFNAADWNHAANGLEIYCITPRGSPSTEYDELLVRDMVQETGNRNETQSFALASIIYQSLHGATLNMFDRGVKRARFAVLRLTKAPAVLIEGGFLTNPDDARRVATTSWRNDYAKAIARGILEYRKLAEFHQAPRTMADYRAPADTSPSISVTGTPSPTPVVNPISLRDLPQASPSPTGQAQPSPSKP